MVQDSKIVNNKKNEWITFLFNLLFPGSGYFYLGKEYYKKGKIYVITTFVIYVISAVFPPFGILVIGYCFYIWADGFTETNKINHEVDWKIRVLNEKEAKKEEENLKAETEEAKKMHGDYFVDIVQKSYELYQNELLDEDEFRSRKEKLITQINLNKVQETPEDFLALIIPLKEKGMLSQAELKEIKSYIL